MMYLRAIGWCNDQVGGSTDVRGKSRISNEHVRVIVQQTAGWYSNLSHRVEGQHVIVMAYT